MLNFSEYIEFVIAFYQTHTLIAIVIGLVVIYLIYQNAKFFLKILGLAILLAGTMYFILQAASSGVSEKKKLIEKGNVHVEE